MGLHVIGVRRSARPHRYCDEVVGLDQLHSVLPRAGFIVVSAPSTAQTDGMIGGREFALMKSTAGFVNFARARLVDYNALAKVLREGKLGAAILDVFDPEPLPADSFLRETPNLLITPHGSSEWLIGRSRTVSPHDARPRLRQRCKDARRAPLRNRS